MTSEQRMAKSLETSCNGLIESIIPAFARRGLRDINLNLPPSSSNNLTSDVANRLCTQLVLKQVTARIER
jgi:hypothetical protein